MLQPDASRDTPDLAIVLRARGISKSFPGVRALSGVDFELRRGEIHALMGENGAGKSTLIKVLTGVEQPDDGSIILDGQAVRPDGPRAAAESGIATVYQEVNLVPQLSVMENVCMGRFPRAFGFIRWRHVRRTAEHALARLGIDIDVTRPLNTYPIAVQQMVAIARAVGVGPASKVLILDEPTSSLDEAEVSRLFAVMDQLRRQGLGIVFVTHFLDQVYRVADRITVLRNGARVGQWNAVDLPRLALIGAMVGRDLEPSRYDQADHGAGSSRASTESVRVDGLGKRRLLQPLTFEVPRGTRTGLAGLLGSGRTEAARLIFGLERADSGHVQIDGAQRRFRTPRQAILAGVAMTGEDRKADGVFPTLSVRENVALALQAKRGILRPLSSREQRELARAYAQRLGIKASDLNQPIGTLSGGNQQKCLIARWLATGPRLLILDEPTRGIDVGAKADVRRLIESLCSSGMSVLFISSELEEVAEMCERVVVLKDRSWCGELHGGQITPDAILRLIAQSPAAAGGEAGRSSA